MVSSNRYSEMPIDASSVDDGAVDAVDGVPMLPIRIDWSAVDTALS